MCKHHWILSPDNHGKCCLCPAERDFNPKKNTKRQCRLERTLWTKGGFYLQGSISGLDNEGISSFIGNDTGLDFY